MLPTPFLHIIALTFFFLLTGCSNNGSRAIERSLQEYNQGQWSISAMWANKALDNKNDQDEAAYVLGLCEFRMQHAEKARGWFEQAAQSKNKAVRGRASAMLGIIASNKGDYVTAALAFEQATSDLDGIDKAKASSHSVAAKGGNSFTSSVSIGGYTLQFGAYQSLENAKKAAETLGSDLRLAGLGSPAIVEEKFAVGKSLFMVQAGSFDSRGSASRCRKRNALPQCIVTAVQ
jgi:tetratricopeptide (TPR) repeat protein